MKTASPLDALMAIERGAEEAEIRGAITPEVMT